MPVNTTHSSYRADDYEIMRTSFEGESAIKAQGSEILPKPSGLVKLENSSLAADVAAAKAAYAAYKLRATYTALIAPSIEGHVGMAHRKPWTVGLPKRLEYVQDRMNESGMSLDEFREMMTREVLLVGRIGLLVDIDSSSQVAIKPYVAETIINWRHEGGKLVRVVLQEVEEREANDDRFVMTLHTSYRVLELIDGQYLATEYKKAENGQFIPEDPVVSTLQIGEIPFVVAGSTCTGIEANEPIPLRPMADHLLTAYRTSADRRQALHMVAQPTPYMFGHASDEAPPTLLGSAAMITSTNAEAKLGYAEVSGNGIDSLKADEEEQISLALMHSHHLAERGKQVESGDALSTRVMTRMASTRSVVSNGAYALAQALRYGAEYISANPDDVMVQANTDFVQTAADNALAKTFGEQVQNGVLPKSVYYQYLRDTGQTELTDDELDEQLDEWREQEDARLLKMEPPVIEGEDDLQVA